MREKVVIFWFRRDLRLHDNVGLFNALNSNFPVLPIFIFDTEILDKLPKNDARVSFIFDNLQLLRSKLLEIGSSLALYYGKPATIFRDLLQKYEILEVFTNGDYEPYARERDAEIENLLAETNISFHVFKDHVIFEKNEIVKPNGDPYVVYTPYMNLWKENFRKISLSVPSVNFDNFLKATNLPNLDLNKIGFEPSGIKVPGKQTLPELIKEYDKNRNFPSRNGTSRIGPHLRFGTISIRKIVAQAASEKNETFLQELIWREFFMQILFHYPETVTKAFKSKYDRIPWRNNEEEFELWKAGKTGFPLVDAGMHQLKQTGFMHNRIRMLVASFLCKHLLIDWRWGEAYFAEKLLDYEMASNVGNWQWAAGSGVDAAPYFRIFNPTTQIIKFDPQYSYIKKFVPEFGTADYPEPMVDHKEARERALQVYKAALS